MPRTELTRVRRARARRVRPCGTRGGAMWAGPPGGEAATFGGGGKDLRGRMVLPSGAEGSLPLGRRESFLCCPSTPEGEGG